MRKLVTLLVLALGIPVAQAALDTALQMQTLLENRLTPVVREFDPNALVQVTVTLKEAEAVRDEVVAPYTLRSLETDGARVHRVSVVILTGHSDLPLSLKRMVKEFTGSLASVTTVRTRTFPTDMVKWRESLAKPTVHTPAASPTFFTHLKQSVRKATATECATVLIGMCLLLVALQVAFHLKSGTTSLHKTMEKGAERLATALEKQGQSAGNGLDSAEVLAEFSASTSVGSRVLEGLTDDGLVALLTDCYWGEFDSYAAFLWNRIPVGRRSAVLSHESFLTDYATHLTWQRESDFHAEQEPYYLDPLALGHLSNEKLTEIARRQPSLLFRLSPLRLAGLRMDARERIELTRQALGDRKPKENFDFASEKASPCRALSRRTLITVQNDAEELALLEHSDLNLEIVQNAPSLGWWMRLGDDQVTDLLARFSARELASAWVAPRVVLDRLERCVPARKLRLLYAARARFGATRHGATFAQLHRLAVEQLAASNVFSAPTIVTPDLKLVA